MKPFGKNEDDLTADEKKFFHLCFALATEMLMDAQMLGPLAKLIGMPMPSHNKEVVSITIFGGTQILGLPVPTSQEEFNALQKQVEESDYSIEKLLYLYGEEYVAFLALPENQGDKEEATERFARQIMDKIGIPHNEPETADEPQG